MAFENVGSILRMGSLPSSYKLLLVAASSSRPKLRPLCMALLHPFATDGQVQIRYRCYGREVHCFIRLSDLQSDLQSVFELSVRDNYDLDLGFCPDLIIDAGGNIGLFTLRAAAGSAAVSGSPAELVICEPLPRNLEQITRHLELNHVQAKMLAGCMGGYRRSIPFYCREAIDSSFEPDKPYDSVVDVPVFTLEDAIGSSPANRILIKLDIEGMEIEVLRSFVPKEHRAVYIVGELHNYEKNSSALEEIFKEHGWEFAYRVIQDDHANFQACSPAALPMLASMKTAA
jgi:FkbM family methyltransferase